MKKSHQAGRVAGTILLVDDEPEIVMIFQRVLEDAGHRVLPSTTPAHALEIAERAIGGIDLLLSDVMMPGIDGFELSRRLRIMHQDLKVLFMSEYVEGTLPIDPRTIMLHKPLSRTALCAAVSEMLGPVEAR